MQDTPLVPQRGLGCACGWPGAFSVRGEGDALRGDTHSREEPCFSLPGRKPWVLCDVSSGRVRLSAPR